MHNGNVEWKVLAHHIDQWCERKSCAHNRRCGEERWGKDECWWMWGEQAVGSGVHCSYALYPSLFLTLSPLFPTIPSPSFLLYFSPSHYTHFSLPSSQCVLQIPLFIPSSLSLAWEAGAHSIYHPLSEFIWSRGLISGLGRCCSESSQTYLNSQKLINTVLIYIYIFQTRLKAGWNYDGNVLRSPNSLEE